MVHAHMELLAQFSPRTWMLIFFYVATTAFSLFMCIGYNHLTFALDLLWYAASVYLAYRLLLHAATLRQTARELEAERHRTHRPSGRPARSGWPLPWVDWLLFPFVGPGVTGFVPFARKPSELVGIRCLQAMLWVHFYRLGEYATDPFRRHASINAMAIELVVDLLPKILFLLLWALWIVPVNRHRHRRRPVAHPMARRPPLSPTVACCFSGNARGLLAASLPRRPRALSAAPHPARLPARSARRRSAHRAGGPTVGLGRWRQGATSSLLLVGHGVRGAQGAASSGRRLQMDRLARYALDLALTHRTAASARPGPTPGRPLREDTYGASRRRRAAHASQWRAGAGGRTAGDARPLCWAPRPHVGQPRCHAGPWRVANVRPSGHELCHEPALETREREHEREFTCVVRLAYTLRHGVEVCRV